MLKTISRFTSSFSALVTDRATVIDADGRMESIRSAMQVALSEGGSHQSVDSSKTWADIARANDVQTLWYLRSDVLKMLADAYGEQRAHNKLDEITELFRGVVPRNQMGGPRRIQR